MDALMDRYDELNFMSEYGADYGAKLIELGREFAAEGRVAMAETCRRRGEHYSGHDATVLLAIGGKKATIVKHEIISAKSKSPATRRKQVIYIDVAQ